MKISKPNITLNPKKIKESFYIDFGVENKDILKIEIIAFNGKVIKTIAGNSKQIDVSELRSGVYMLKYYDQSYTANTRLFIKD